MLLTETQARIVRALLDTRAADARIIWPQGKAELVAWVGPKSVWTRPRMVTVMEMHTGRQVPVVERYLTAADFFNAYEDFLK